jgi:light-regulated signal transduction histidine kinase (bacteriophytochrome)
VNLLTNALKYGANGPISVKACVEEEKARLTVEDHGIGIAKGDLARIFERFERAAPSRNFGGLGLGLYITRQIVEAHGGRIWAEPAGDGGDVLRGAPSGSSARAEPPTPAFSEAEVMTCRGSRAASGTPAHRVRGTSPRPTSA